MYSSSIFKYNYFTISTEIFLFFYSLLMNLSIVRQPLMENKSMVNLPFSIENYSMGKVKNLIIYNMGISFDRSI